MLRRLLGGQNWAESDVQMGPIKRVVAGPVRYLTTAWHNE